MIPALARPLPDTWDELLEVLHKTPSSGWVICSAWAVGGGDPEGLDIRVLGGRAIYHNAWCVSSEKNDRVRLCRLDPGDGLGPNEVSRYLDPEDVVEVRRR
jgi:hypothetical protein